MPLTAYLLFVTPAPQTENHKKTNNKKKAKQLLI